jgi:hypothetical protein
MTATPCDAIYRVSADQQTDRRIGKTYSSLNDIVANFDPLGAIRLHHTDHWPKSLMRVLHDHRSDDLVQDRLDCRLRM